MFFRNSRSYQAPLCSNLPEYSATSTRYGAIEKSIGISVCYVVEKLGWIDCLPDSAFSGHADI